MRATHTRKHCSFSFGRKQKFPRSAPVTWLGYWTAVSHRSGAKGEMEADNCHLTSQLRDSAGFAPDFPGCTSLHYDGSSDFLEYKGFNWQINLISLGKSIVERSPNG